MDKLLRTLIENEEVSLVAINSAEMVRHAQIIHGLSKEATRLFGRVLTIMTYMSCWLKNGDSQLSVNIKQHGEAGEVCVSGDGNLYTRGYVYNPNTQSDALGRGYITVVRDDHYKRPFVGTCELIGEDVDKNFEYYYSLSEGLPTYMKTEVTFDEFGLCKSSVGFFLQPMPEASEKSKGYAQATIAELKDLDKMLEKADVGAILKDIFKVQTGDERKIEYHCHCSREYIAGVLTTLGERELRDIIQKEGKINVHCHYCNSDYDFFDKDVDEMFPAKA